MATGTNRVTANNDPTAHAEVSAIRAACAKEQTFKLDGCTCYTSCEPCPMCLSALYWAGVSRIVYGNTKDDAKAIDFDGPIMFSQREQRFFRADSAITVFSFKTSDMLTNWVIEATAIIIKP